MQDGKGSLEEGGTRIAYFASYPGHPLFAANTVVNARASNVDILPTIAELTGGKASHWVDGVSWLDNLESDDSGGSGGSGRRRFVFAEAGYDRVVYHEDMKLLRLGNGANFLFNTTGEEEVDLTDEPNAGTERALMTEAMDCFLEVTAISNTPFPAHVCDTVGK